MRVSLIAAAVLEQTAPRRDHPNVLPQTEARSYPSPSATASRIEATLLWLSIMLGYRN
jgi:hypothetical protein